MATLGEKIKFFRLRANISQMDLEIDSNSAFGSISRIESGKVNPTKETINKIISILKLNDRETDYLIGSISNPASNIELKLAEEEVKDYFSNPNVLGYLVDDRYRLVDTSITFKKLANISDSEFKKNIQYKTLPEILLDNNLNINNLFNHDFNKTLKHLLERFKSEMGFMVGDKYYEKIISTINSNEIAKSIWEEIENNKNNNVVFHKSIRNINITNGNLVINVHYSNEILSKYKRFDLVEYYPDSNFFNAFLISKH